MAKQSSKSAKAKAKPRRSAAAGDDTGMTMLAWNDDVDDVAVEGLQRPPVAPQARGLRRAVRAGGLDGGGLCARRAATAPAQRGDPSTGAVDDPPFVRRAGGDAALF